MLNETGDGAGEMDFQGNLTFINDAGWRLWGYTREEILRSNHQIYIDREGAKFLRQAYREVYQTGMPGRFLSLALFLFL